MKLQEDKTRFINNLPWRSEEEKQKVLDFFKTHANLESKIQNWQSKDKENLVNEIRNLISETETARLEKEKVKQGYRGNIDWESHDCRYFGEDENWIYITPLSWKGGKFCDSAECGGAGAKWCIGWEKSDRYWNYYRQDLGVLFLMKLNKHPKDKRKDLKFMIEGYLGKDEVNIWNQQDSKENYALSKVEKRYLKAIQKIQDNIKKKAIAKYFGNPEPGVYIAKNEEALKHIEDIKRDLKVFKVKEGVVFKNVVNASHMFDRCASLTSVDTSGFINVENASYMFRSCTSLTSIDTSVFANVKTATEMFRYCISLTSIDASRFKNVRNASYMFRNCTSLTSINTSAFENIGNASGMFSGCESLTSIDTSAFKKVQNASHMFQGCTSLTSVDTSAFVKVRNASDMFYGCKSLTSINTSAFVNVKNAEYMFRDCTSLTSINTFGFVNVESTLSMFMGCTSLTSIDTSGFVNVVFALGMFNSCTSLKTYIPGPNGKVNKGLEELGAKPVKRLGESYRRRMVEEILEE